MTAPRVFTIPPDAPFARALAEGVIARCADRGLSLADVSIYLPTRRAARTFGDAFATQAGGATLLPQFLALGEEDEDAFALLEGDLADIPPAIAPLRRQMLLAAMVQRWRAANGRQAQSFAGSLGLAKGLAQVLDDAETYGVPLDALDTLVPDVLAAHWADVRDFLMLLRDQWPAILAAEGCIDPAARRNRVMNALAERMPRMARGRMILAAGSTGSIPATARLLSAIAHLPDGGVILPGLDTRLDDESWRRIDPGHPQYGMKQLLERLGIEREAVRPWDGAAGSARADLWREVLRPAPATDAWRDLAERGGMTIADGLRGLAYIEAADAAEESAVIALALRHALEDADTSAALVTPDRVLARRVAAQLRRWDIRIDDSGGRPLAHTPAGAFLCLLAEAASTDFAPVPLLALLKHPFAALGQDGAAFRARARDLDRVLRGPRPNAGLAGVTTVVARAGGAELAVWWAGVAAALQPLEDILARPTGTLPAMLAAHVGAAHAMAARADEGNAIVQAPESESLVAFLETLAEAAAGIPEIETRAYAAIFRDLAGEQTIRRAGFSHPRLAILGPLEARLQHFDLTILGGLNETVWPRAAGVDPWFSRPMREAMGLEQPERRIGQSAHDFMMFASGPRVLMTRAAKSDGVSSIASRWLQRLVQLTRGLGLEELLEAETDYAGIARALDQGEPAERPAPPRPTPPLASRPRSLSVTEIENWIRDPYAIYAKHILGLRPLDPLDEPIGPRQRGNAIHQTMEAFLRRYPDALPENADIELAHIADDIFAQSGIPKAALALWRPRFLGAASWFIEVERERRTRVERSLVEIKGTRVFAAPGGDFTLRARADRVDILADGGGAIIDYKTGAPPSAAQVTRGYSPQLPLEGAILAAGGFSEAGARPPRELTYYALSGGAQRGKAVNIPNAEDVSREAAEKLAALVSFFDDETVGYPSRVRPVRADLSGDYDHLARVREWSLSGWSDDVTPEDEE